MAQTAMDADQLMECAHPGFRARFADLARAGAPPFNAIGDGMGFATIVDATGSKLTEGGELVFEEDAGLIVAWMNKQARRPGPA